MRAVTWGILRLQGRLRYFMQKKKIIYIITKGNWGGAQRYVFDLTTHLPKNRFETVVAVGEGSILEKKLAAERIRTVKIRKLRETRRVKPQFTDIGSFFDLLRLFRHERPDIVHLNSSRAALFGSFAARVYILFLWLKMKNTGLKIIFTVHGWPFNEHRNWLVKTFIWLASYVTALLSTDIIVIASREFEQAKTMPFIITKTHLIPNGVKVPEFLSREEARKKLKMRQDALVVGSIGELTWNKDYPELVMVAARLLGERFDFELAVIGEGENRAEITRRVKGSPVLDGHKILFGFKEDAYTYLKAFDIFVLNSRKEGLPYVVLEAGVAGLPVVATSVGGIPDIIENDRTGLLAPPYRMDEALRKLLTEKETREKLGSALKERVEKTFSFERMLTETQKLYERKLS